MYMSFAISGVVDIVSQKVLKERLIALEKAAVAAAFFITALLLFYHKHGKVRADLKFCISELASSLLKVELHQNNRLHLINRSIVLLSATAQMDK